MNLDAREWLETDGLGGFASGTVSGVRTRRYHGLLLVATTPPTGRMMLVNGFDAWVETPNGRVYISNQRYLPDVLHPDGFWRIDQFHADPWPTWRWRVTDDADVTQEVFVSRGSPRTVVRWQLTGRPTPAKLFVRPFLSGRHYHALHRENAAFNFDAQTSEAGVVTWHPYLGVPGIRSRSNGTYTPDPQWYRDFLYLEERSRGLDDVEDLASPGTYEWDLSSGEAVWIVESTTAPDTTELPVELAQRLRHSESERRRAFPSRLHRHADDYIVKRGDGCTIVAGYPWFTDWGRDTFVAVRGLCLATGRVATARRILLEWADTVTEGMLPNRFPEGGEAPEFNAVDASLWFVIAVHDLLRASEGSRSVTDAHRRRLLMAVEQILRGYARGTRYRIHLDADGLLAAGVPGQNLTWMDAKIGDLVVTPRIGKPVEVQALWLNALAFAGRDSADWRRLFERGLAQFQAKFWNAERSCLFDVVDVDHLPGRVDGSLRPNQIFAVGGLPVAILTGTRARRVVDAVERALATPMGLRTLAPGDHGYHPRYDGNTAARDAAYHNGTVWPWLMGPFVEAWIRVRDDTPHARAEARERFLRPLLGELERLGLGHLPEIADAEAPFTPRGCPFQAWSLGELLRLLDETQGV
ncbi:MAG TPA: amylo-alpha-1,6-glucosidase [Vicinamibacterales bacterium]|nr:amylo-alpha-1,6-glucosidase [Vicinamibacterales bacterium]